MILLHVLVIVNFLEVKIEALLKETITFIFLENYRIVLWLLML